MNHAMQAFQAEAMAADDRYATAFVRLSDLYDKKLNQLADRHESEYNRAVANYREAMAKNLQPGMVLDAGDGSLWFARISRSDLPLRLTPADLSNEGGLKTLPVGEYFERYPLARVVFPAEGHM